MDAKQYEAMVVDAEGRLKRLRALYDQWFAGIERIEPQQQRKELDTLLNTLKREQVRNTALRFRLQQVVQRYTTYNTYWRRIARQIEEGTYKRDVIRARRLADVMPSSVPPPPRPEAKDSTPAPSGVDVEIDHAVDSVLGGIGPGPARPSPRPPPMVSPLALPDSPKLEPTRSFPAPAAGAGRPPGPPPPPAAAIKRGPPPPPPAAGVRPPPPAAGRSADGIGDDQLQRS